MCHSYVNKSQSYGYVLDLMFGESPKIFQNDLFTILIALSILTLIKL